MMEPMKYELEELLYQMGIYLVQAGYAVVVEAAALAVEEPERLQSLTQEFYPRNSIRRWAGGAGAHGTARNGASERPRPRLGSATEL